MVPVVLTPGDYPALASFLEHETGGAIGRGVWTDRFGCFWEHNPVFRSGEFQRGWLLRDASGAIGGFLGSIPRRYAWKGRDAAVCATTSWYVRPDMRQYSLLLLRDFMRQPYPLLNTTPVANTEAVFVRCGFRSLNSDWTKHEFLAPATVSALTVFLAQGAGKLGHLAGLAVLPACGLAALSAGRRAVSGGMGAGTVSLREVGRFSDEFDDLWRGAGSLEEMTAVRDAEQLNWMYFSSPLLSGGRKVFEVSRDGGLAGYVGVKVLTRGSARYWEVVDIFLPQADAWFLNGVLRRLLKTASNEPNLALVRLRGYTEALVQAARRCGFFRNAAPSGLFCKGGGFGPEDHPNLSPFDGDRPFFP